MRVASEARDRKAYAVSCNVTIEVTSFFAASQFKGWHLARVAQAG